MSEMQTEDVIAMLNDIKLNIMHRRDAADRTEISKYYDYDKGIDDSIKMIDRKINLISKGGTKEVITGKFD